MYSPSRCKNHTCTGLQTTPFHGGQYRAGNGNLLNFGLPIAMLLCLHQSNVYIKRKLRVWRVQKCIPLIDTKTSLTWAGLQTTQSHVSQYMAENWILWKSWSTFCHGTVFAPKQCLYQKKATGVESPKMYSSHWCKNLTYLCGAANNPITTKPG